MVKTVNSVKRKVFFKNIPVSLIGRRLKIDGYAHNFKVVDRELNNINLVNFGDKIKIITTFPSLNTSVCSLQVKKFNNELYKKSDDIVYLGISKDLPFAQKVFCDDNNISNIILLSDYKYSSFGINYGLLIKELNLLARSALIIDRNNVLRYLQIADETTNELDYENILVNLEKIQNEPEIKSVETYPLNCVHDQEHTIPLSENKVNELLEDTTGWKLVNDNKIIKYYLFSEHLDAKNLIEMINTIAEEQDHHPEITLNYNKIKIELTTHSANGLTANDFILAKIINELE